ncbi:MAG: hypothetical protein ACJKTH_00125 [Patescibacteria group bacterium UBA2163]
MIREAAVYLEKNRTCPKHRVEHTGSNAYLLDFYDYLGEIEKGKKFVWYLLDLVVESPEGAKVFYPGHLNPMNMSQNVIDTGTAVDAVARFATNNRDSFSKKEHEKIQTTLREVAEGYLVKTARSKKITNQRLWGLTGLASYARYLGEESAYRTIAHESIERAFKDATPDGFFRYYPDPAKNSLPYDDITTFYQSRHTAFAQYTLNALNIKEGVYEEALEASIGALLSMYDSNGIKDLRMECKRWYWLSSYEVASHAFDAYALSHSKNPIAQKALNNVLYQVRQHFFDGFLHSHKGLNFNFQCPIFWTAHLAWLTRIDGIEDMFNHANELQPFLYTFHGKEVFSDTNQARRILINTRWQKRNPTTGIYQNGLDAAHRLRFQIPRLPYAYFFSVKEVLNHSWYALRGGHAGEAIVRLWRFFTDSVTMVLPWYQTGFGKIVSMEIEKESVKLTVLPASKFGTLLKKATTKNISL